MNHHFHHNMSIMSLLNTCVLFHFVAKCRCAGCQETPPVGQSEAAASGWTNFSKKAAPPDSPDVACLMGQMTFKNEKKQ